MTSLHDANSSATSAFFFGNDAVYNTSKHLAFLKFYQEAAYLQAGAEVFCKVGGPVLGTHERVRELVLKLREDPTYTKENLQQLIRQDVGYSDDDVEHAIRTIVRIGFMLDCSLTKNFSRIYCLRNYVPQRWKLQDSFEDFVNSSIPWESTGTLAPYDYRALISAVELKARCKIILQRTDNIANHLQYDPSGPTPTLKIFHQMDYLRAQLRKYPAPLTATSLKDSLKLGTLPPQLILETIESFYGLLFPIVMHEDGPSRNLLKRLVDEDGFDCEALMDIEDHSDWIPDDFKYRYWGPRLKKLHEISQEPIIKSTWLSWMDRYTKDQKALILAIAGLFLSALFGFLGFVVGIAQLAVSVDAWKQPIPSGS